MRLVTPMRDLPWSKICVIVRKKEMKESIKSINSFFAAGSRPRRKFMYDLPYIQL